MSKRVLDKCKIYKTLKADEILHVYIDGEYVSDWRFHSFVDGVLYLANISTYPNNDSPIDEHSVISQLVITNNNYFRIELTTDTDEYSWDDLTIETE